MPHITITLQGLDGVKRNLEAQTFSLQSIFGGMRTFYETDLGEIYDSSQVAAEVEPDRELVVECPHCGRTDAMEVIPPDDGPSTYICQCGHRWDPDA